MKIIDTPENRESLKIAYRLVQGDNTPDLAVDKEAMAAMVGPQEYIESLVSSKNMRERGKVILTGEAGHDIQQLLLEGF